MDEQNTGFSAAVGGGVTTRPMTFGERSVGLTLNPSGDERVTHIKKMYATIIDNLAGANGENLEGQVYSLRLDLLGSAVENAITAQMWAVKAITFKD